MSNDGWLWLQCEGAGIPGGDWSADIEFRRLKKGFSVWQRLYDGYSATSARFLKVGDSRESLNWRRAVEWLRGPSIDGLGGWELLRNVKVGGIEEPWARELCAIAWIEHENEFEPVLDALLPLDDMDIAACRKFFGPLSDEAALARFRDLEDAMPSFSINELGIPRLISELEWSSEVRWDELIGRAESLNEIYVLAEESEIVCASLDAVAAAAGFDRRPPLEELIGRLETLSATVAERLQGEKDAEVAKLAALTSSSQTWSSARISECFGLGGLLPARLAADVLAAWSSLDTKPHGDDDDCLEVLRWILSGFGDHGLTVFRESNYSEFIDVVDWVIALEIEQDEEVERRRTVRGGAVSGPALAARRRKEEEKLKAIREVGGLLRDAASQQDLSMLQLKGKRVTGGSDFM